jgi:hypothetical protein
MVQCLGSAYFILGMAYTGHVCLLGESPANQAFLWDEEDGTIIGMAGLPATKDQSTPSPREQKTLAQQAVVAGLLAQGIRHTEIAKRLGRGDKEKIRYWRKRIRNWAYDSDRFQQMVAREAKGELTLGLGKATQGLIRRAGAGRPDAVKLLFEAQGFHNPKMQHEHSGDISIRLELPRPTPPKAIDSEATEVS